MWPPLGSGREPLNGKILNPLLTIMTFSIEDLGDIDLTIGQWCLDKVPPELKKQVDHDYEVDGQSVTIFEVRPLWRG